MLIRDDIQNTIDSVFKDLHDHVAMSLGPEGHTTIINQDKGRQPIVTKDGVTIAKHYKADSKIGEVVANIVKEMCQSTDQRVGDGTTSTIIFAHSLYVQLRRALGLGCNYNSIVEGMSAAINDITDLVIEYATDVKNAHELKNVAYVSANNDQVLADLIYEALDKSGKNGAIITSKSIAGKTRVEVREGFTAEGGYLSKAFINDDINRTVKYENPRIIVTNHILRDFKEDIEPFLRMHNSDGVPMVIYAESIEESALAGLIFAASQKDIKVCPMNAPFYGRAKDGFLEDVAAFSGATMLIKEDGQKISAKFTMAMTGRAKYFEAKHNESLLVGGSADPIKMQSHINFLCQQRDLSIEEIDAFEIFNSRISRLGSSSATIYIGGHTEAEVVEKRYRIEDALRAIHAATQQGIVPGGGVIGLRIAERLAEKHSELSTSNPSYYSGYHSTVESLKSIFHQLLVSGRLEEKEFKIATKIVENENPNYGYNLLTKVYCDLKEAGIIEPAVTLISVINNSTSIVKLLLNSSAIIL
jgi:chaperonin GroEL